MALPMFFAIEISPREITAFHPVRISSSSLHFGCMAANTQILVGMAASPQPPVGGGALLLIGRPTPRIRSSASRQSLPANSPAGP